MVKLIRKLVFHIRLRLFAWFNIGKVSVYGHNTVNKLRDNEPIATINKVKEIDVILKELRSSKYRLKGRELSIKGSVWIQEKNLFSLCYIVFYSYKPLKLIWKGVRRYG